jgi:hypothetical protein
MVVHCTATVIFFRTGCALLRATSIKHYFSFANCQHATALRFVWLKQKQLSFHESQRFYAASLIQHLHIRLRRWLKQGCLFCQCHLKNGFPNRYFSLLMSALLFASAFLRHLVVWLLCAYTRYVLPTSNIIPQSGPPKPVMIVNVSALSPLNICEIENK